MGFKEELLLEVGIPGPYVKLQRDWQLAGIMSDIEAIAEQARIFRGGRRAVDITGKIDALARAARKNSA